MTVLSLDTDVAAPIVRETRLTTILLVGRVSIGARHDICRIRDISTGGMRIETLAPVDVGQRIRVDLKNGVSMPSQVVWVRPAEAGMRFDTPVDVEQVLAPADGSRQTSGVRVMRAPRLSARCPVVLRSAGLILPGVVIDISQGGAQVLAHGASKIGDQLVLVLPGLGARRAAVRWQGDGTLGLSFDDKVGFADLSQWLAGPHRFAPEPVAPEPVAPESLPAVSPSRRSS